MRLSDFIAIGLGLALTAYALLAGADFGAGILHLTFTGRPHQQGSLTRTIGPLWEANHVWLIFCITILFSAFPAAFAALGRVLLAPFTLVLMALVVRGVAFGVLSGAAGLERADRLLGRAFGAASVIAPLLFGASAAAVAQVSSAARTASAAPAGGTPLSVPWTGLFAGMVGLLAVALCAHLGAVFMTSRLERAGEMRLVDGFRRRGLQTGTALLGFSVLALLVAAWKAPSVWHRLTTAGLALVVIGLLATVASVISLARRRYSTARGATLLAGGALMWGWFIAQSPHLIGTRLTIDTAAATAPALTALAVAGGLVLIAVLPAFYLLYVLFARPSPEVTE
ncbi:MAG TPA: cytochrome d ubiquinol oxidase subunit II [Solirubrobacteraceae bacterium]